MVKRVISSFRMLRVQQQSAPLKFSNKRIKGGLGENNFSGVIQVESSFQWPKKLNGR